MNKYILICVMTIALLGGCSQPSVAGSYEMVKGKGVEVCEAYKENLNSFKPQIPMMCLRKINDSSKGFSKPKFKRFYSSDEMMKKIDLYLWERDANPAYYILTKNENEWTGSKKQLLTARNKYIDIRSRRRGIGHEIALMDIDNDGNMDNVYLDQACNAFGSILMVLNKSKTDIDYVKTALVMRHPSRKEAGWPVYSAVNSDMKNISPDIKKRGYSVTPDSLHDVFYDVFSYKDRAYFDQVWDASIVINGKIVTKSNRLNVYTIEKNKTNEICSLKFSY